MGGYWQDIFSILANTKIQKLRLTGEDENSAVSIKKTLLANNTPYLQSIYADGSYYNENLRHSLISGLKNNTTLISAHRADLHKRKHTILYDLLKENENFQEHVHSGNLVTFIRKHDNFCNTKYLTDYSIKKALYGDDTKQKFWLEQTSENLEQIESSTEHFRKFLDDGIRKQIAGAFFADAVMQLAQNCRIKNTHATMPLELHLKQLQNKHLFAIGAYGQDPQTTEEISRLGAHAILKQALIKKKIKGEKYDFLFGGKCLKAQDDNNILYSQCRRVVFNEWAIWKKNHLASLTKQEKLDIEGAYSALNKKPFKENLGMKELSKNDKDELSKLIGAREFVLVLKDIYFTKLKLTTKILRDQIAEKFRQHGLENQLLSFNAKYNQPTEVKKWYAIKDKLQKAYNLLQDFKFDENTRTNQALKLLGLENQIEHAGVDENQIDSCTQRNMPQNTILGKRQAYNSIADLDEQNWPDQFDFDMENFSLKAEPSLSLSGKEDFLSESL